MFSAAIMFIVTIFVDQTSLSLWSFMDIELALTRWSKSRINSLETDMNQLKQFEILLIVYVSLQHGDVLTECVSISPLAH